MKTDTNLTSIASFLKEGFDQLPNNVTEQLGSLAASSLGNPIAGAFLSMVVAGLVQQKTVEASKYAGQQLSDTVEQLDEDQRTHALVARGIRGLLVCLPNGQEWDDSLTKAANGDPEMLVSLLETCQNDPERQRELETAVTDVFRGELGDHVEGSNHDDFLDFYKDVFDADTKDDALAMFLHIREMLLSREVHEVLQTVSGLPPILDELSHELERTRKDLENNLNSILEANLKDEGFKRLSPYYFARHDPSPPATEWRAGFTLAGVHEGHALEREYQTKDGNRRKVQQDIRDELADNTDIAVVGRPGTGKSTICRTVACRWYDNREGTVFYRESETGQRFTRTGVLENRIRNAEGHVLVVVEDACRENANSIFEVMAEFQSDDSVSFLLDSRVEEWKKATEEFTNPRILNLKEELEQYRVPEFDVDECARVLTKFEKVTGLTVVETPEELFEEIETDISAGEMYLLGYRLSSYAINPISQENTQETTGLRSEVGRVYNQLTRELDDLAQHVGMLINVLNAAEFGIYPELIHALAENDEDHGQIETLLSQFKGYLLFEGDERFRSNHPFWSAMYLEHALAKDKFRAIHIFEQCVNAIFRLLEDPDRRRRIRHWRRGEVNYLDEIEQNTRFIADSIADDVFELGKRHPGLAALYSTSENSKIRLPSTCSPERELYCIKLRGEMYLEAGELDTAEAEFRRLLDKVPEVEIADNEGHKLTGQSHRSLSEISRNRGELDDARRQLEQSIEIFEKIENKQLKGVAFADLGTVARRGGNLDEAIEYHDKSLNLCRETGYRIGAAKALNNRGMAKKDLGNLDEAHSDLSRSIELKQETGHRQSSVAISINTLGEILYEKGELKKAEQKLEQSLRMKQEVGYRNGSAWSLYYLGLVAKKRDNLETAKTRLLRSLKIRRDVDDELGIGRCLNALGEVYCQRGQFDRAEAYHDWSLRSFESVGDELGIARYRVNVGNIKYEEGFLQEALDHYQTGLRLCENIGNPREIARARRGIGRVARRLESYEEARENLSKAVDALEGISAYRDAGTVVEELIDVCTDANDHTAAREWRERLREFEEKS